VTLTAEPWTLTPEAAAEAGRQGLDERQIEAAVGVVSMFNYFTRVADAVGIEFDYQTPLPAFEPDLLRVAAPRPTRAVSSSRVVGSRRHPVHPPLRAAWESWRSYLLETDEPISRRERRLLASVAAEEAGDWEGVGVLSESRSPEGGDDDLVWFARKLSRQPWRMVAGDLERLRASGYSDRAILHVISVVAQQNADSRLITGLAAGVRS
jgi:alkylhydroperoxidase family enzyme